MVLLGVSELFVGPSYMIAFKPHLWLMLIGLFFSEFFAAFNIIPVVPEIIEATNELDKQRIINEGRLAGLDELIIENQVE